MPLFMEEEKKNNGKVDTIIQINHWIYQREVLNTLYIQTNFVLQQKSPVIENCVTVIFRRVNPFLIILRMC